MLWIFRRSRLSNSAAAFFNAINNNSSNNANNSNTGNYLIHSFFVLAKKYFI